MSTDVINEQSTDETVSTHSSPGELLQAGRTRAGLSVSEVADRLKVPEGYVTGIELSDFEKLPGLVFARGYVRSYAKLVQLDADQVVLAFDRFTGNQSGDTPSLQEGKPIENRRHVNPLLSWGGTLAVILAIGVASYYGWNSGQQRLEAEPEAPVALQSETEGSGQVDVLVETMAETEVGLPLQEAVESAVRLDELETEQEELVIEDDAAQEESGLQQDVAAEFEEEEGAAESSTPVEAVSSAVRLVIRFTEDCWVQVKDMSGKSLYADIQRAGSELDLEVPAAVEVKFGNVPGVSALNFAGRSVEVKPASPGRKVASLVLGSLDAG